MDYLSTEELENLPSYVSQKYFKKEDRWKYILFLTLFLTGARFGEVLGLTWKQIDFNTGWIKISQMWDGTNHKITGTTKTGRDRKIPLQDSFKIELSLLKRNSTQDFIFSNTGKKPIDPSHFRSRRI